MLKVLVVEKSDSFREELRRALVAPEFDCFVAADLQEAAWHLRKHAVDIAIVGVDAPGGSALDFVTTLRGSRLSSRATFVVTSGSRSDFDLFTVAGTEGLGFLPRDTSRGKLAEAVRKFAPAPKAPLLDAEFTNHLLQATTGAFNTLAGVVPVFGKPRLRRRGEKGEELEVASQVHSARFSGEIRFLFSRKAFATLTDLRRAADGGETTGGLSHLVSVILGQVRKFSEAEEKELRFSPPAAPGKGETMGLTVVFDATFAGESAFRIELRLL